MSLLTPLTVGTLQAVLGAQAKRAQALVGESIATLNESRMREIRLSGLMRGG